MVHIYSQNCSRIRLYLVCLYIGLCICVCMHTLSCARTLAHPLCISQCPVSEEL